MALREGVAGAFHGMPDATRLRMARKRKKAVSERDLEGFKLLEPVSELLAALRDEGNPNRKIHFDHYVTLLIFYFFNPTLTSLRGLQRTTSFSKVQRKLGIPRACLGSLSAAQHMFDHEQLAGVLSELLERLPADKGDARLAQLKKVVTVADGTLLKALPRVAWALWVNEDKRAAKAHVQFEVMKGAPSQVVVTAANGSEKAVFESSLEPNRFYVLDSGYAKFTLLQAVVDVGSNVLCRLPSSWTYEVLEERPLTDADRDARVVRDVVVNLGKAPGNKQLKQDFRIVEIQRVEEPSKRMRRERPTRDTIVLVTDRMDLPAELIALLYSARWKIEIFFRWLKCTLGCKKLLMESQNGVAIQFYSALIACLLISLWTGKKPTKRVYEAVCFYLQGLADVEDVLASVRGCKAHAIGG